jgi:hypothetical protein
MGLCFGTGFQNHMSVGTRQSLVARCIADGDGVRLNAQLWFDIDWRAPDSKKLHGKVLSCPSWMDYYWKGCVGGRQTHDRF